MKYHKNLIGIIIVQRLRGFQFGDWKLFLAAQSRATLPHHCPDRDRDTLNTEVYLLVSVFHSVLTESSGIDRGRRRREKTERGEGEGEDA